MKKGLKVSPLKKQEYSSGAAPRRRTSMISLRLSSTRSMGVPARMMGGATSKSMEGKVMHSTMGTLR